MKWDKPTQRPLPDDTVKVDESEDKLKAVCRKLTNVRFSELYSKPSKKEEKAQEKNQKSHEAYFADMPLYSSFTKDKIFHRQPGDKKNKVSS